VNSISLLSTLLPIIAFIWCCRKTHIKGFWVIFFYSIVSLLTDLFISASGWAHDHKFTIWNTFTLSEFLLLSYFFYLTFRVRKIKFAIAIVSIIYLITFIFFAKSLNTEYNPILSFISQVVILSLCLIYLSINMRKTTVSFDLYDPILIIVVAILLYIASTLFLFVMADRLSENERNKYWIITNFSNILTNLLFSISFYLYRYKKLNPPPENHVVDYTSPNDR
jgi:hypothetical protein